MTERLQVALADRYHVERQLGAGGMATVHLALDLKHHRRVAIKVLRPELAAARGDSRVNAGGRHRLTLVIRPRPMHLPRPHDSHP